MKARVVNQDGNLMLLNCDGTISSASRTALRQFLLGFKCCDQCSGTEGRWTDIALDMVEFPGTTMAYVTDHGKLVIDDPAIFQHVFEKISDYMTIEEYAKKHNRSMQLVKLFIQDGRIPGVIRFGRQWAIPKDAPYPVETRSRKPTSDKPFEK